MIRGYIKHYRDCQQIFTGQYGTKLYLFFTTNVHHSRASQIKEVERLSSTTEYEFVIPVSWVCSIAAVVWGENWCIGAGLSQGPKEICNCWMNESLGKSESKEYIHLVHTLLVLCIAISGMLVKIQLLKLYCCVGGSKCITSVFFIVKNNFDLIYSLTQSLVYWLNTSLNYWFNGSLLLRQPLF